MHKLGEKRQFWALPPAEMHAKGIGTAHRQNQGETQPAPTRSRVRTSGMHAVRARSDAASSSWAQIHSEQRHSRMLPKSRSSLVEGDMVVPFEEGSPGLVSSPTLRGSVRPLHSRGYSHTRTRSTLLPARREARSSPCGTLLFSRTGPAFHCGRRRQG